MGAIQEGFGLLATWRWHHSGFIVADLDRALEFYRDTLGYRTTFEARGMTDLFERTVGVRGVSCDLVQMEGPGSPTLIELIRVRGVPEGCDPTLPVHPGIGHAAYLVEDLDVAAEQMRAAGARLLGELVEFSEGRAAYFTTPAGTVIELEEAEPAHEQGGSRCIQ